MSSYDLEMLTNLPFGDLELFPECSLDQAAYKDGVTFDDLPFGKPLSDQPDNSLVDELFPSWLDLKMDLSLLEGLESPDLVLDDLLLSDVNTGQSPDVLPAPHCEGPSNPLALSHLLAETLSPPLTPTDSLVLISPPSSPDWIVPDMGLPSSPSSQCSPAPASPGCNLLDVAGSEPSSPGGNFIAGAAVADTVLTFVAPVPVSVIDAASAAGQTVTLDSFLGLSFIIESSPPLDIGQAEEESPPVASKARKERKRRTPYSRAGSSKAKLSADDEFVPATAQKKERKRMQNKDAATRYRMKKRMESGCTQEQEQQLVEENGRLREKALQLAREMGYLKNLMREMFKARGILP